MNYVTNYKFMTTFLLVVVLKINPQSMELKMLIGGKEKPDIKFIFPSVHDNFPTSICKSFDQHSFSPRQVGLLFCLFLSPVNFTLSQASNIQQNYDCQKGFLMFFPPVYSVCLILENYSLKIFANG